MFDSRILFVNLILMRNKMLKIMLRCQILHFLVLLILTNLKATSTAKINSHRRSFPFQSPYERAELWRVNTVAPEDLSILELEFGADVWEEAENYTSVSIKRQYLNNATSFLNDNRIRKEIIHRNIQNLIDDEDDEPEERQKRQTKNKKMNWTKYHGLGIIHNFLDDMEAKYPNICSVLSIGESLEGRDLKVLRISSSSSDGDVIWIDGGIHAREWISPASVTFIINELVKNWSDLDDSITEKTWYILPIMNPDGYVYSRQSDRLWRKNRRQNKGSKCMGVDLNRNFDVSWCGKGAKTDPCHGTYCGPKAESEPETQAVADFLREHQDSLKAYLTFHSYKQAIAYPWGHRKSKVSDHKELNRIVKLAANRIKRKTKKQYLVGPMNPLLGFLTGTSMDWARDELGVKYSYTIELRDKGRYGFILPAKQIKGTAQEAYIIAKTVAEEI